MQFIYFFEKRRKSSFLFYIFFLEALFLSIHQIHDTVGGSSTVLRKHTLKCRCMRFNKLLSRDFLIRLTNKQ